MVDVTRLPDNAFGYVPTPAIVGPIEFTLPLDAFKELGGHTVYVTTLDELSRNSHATLAPWKEDNPWPFSSAANDTVFKSR